VRDLLLGLKPKDFDVATGATPDAVRRLFRSSRLIGRRFRLAHVRMGREIIEVATFRAGFDDSAGDPDHVRVDGRIVRDNVYGTLEEDAWRRDFTVNCLYYDHREHVVIDFTGGHADLRDRRLRLIGHAVERYREDPVRMLRAVRFAGKLGFDIEDDTSRAIYELAPLIEDMSPARLYEEVIKLFMAGAGCTSYELLRRYGLFGHLFPETDACIEAEPDGIACVLAGKALESTDARIGSGKPVTPGFLFAALLWEPVLHDSEACTARGMSDIQAYDAAGADVIERQVQHVSLPRRFSLMVREIWGLQPRLVNRRGRGGASRLLTNPRFRAAYDFLLLRAESGEDVAEHAQWWTRFQEVDDNERRSMLEDKRGPKRRRRRRRGRGAARPEPTGQPAM
jgi:poly(A) polymerase